MNVYTVLGSNLHREIGTQLTQGSAITLLGSTEIDLTKAQMASDVVILNIFTFMGETTVRIPATWNVSSSLLTMLGETTGMGAGGESSRQCLKVQGMCILGSCRIDYVDLVSPTVPAEDDDPP